MSREGTTVTVGEGYPVRLTRDLLTACNTYGWATILHAKHPGEGFDKAAQDALQRLYAHLRAQVGEDPRNESTAFGQRHLERLAVWLGTWDIPRGHAKGSPAIVPVRSTMDIPLQKEG